ncbi:MAG: sterol desaturase family protein [Polaromonas sp.]
MHLFTLEHGKLAYRADFVLYASASFALMTFLIIAAPREQRLEMMAFSLLGLTGWTLIEYLLHRFVLHGLRPFSSWHARHHQRPAALISTPTILSASLIASLVFLPALILGGLWRACALTFGMLTGYLAYSITHHASHHWRARHAWLKQRKYWHALHHNPHMQPGHYGVTSGFWDYVFGSRHR